MRKRDKKKTNQNLTKKRCVNQRKGRGKKEGKSGGGQRSEGI